MSTRTIESHLSPADREALVRMIETEKPAVEQVRQWLAEHGLKVKTKTAYGVRARLWSGERTPDARKYLKVDKILRPEDRDTYASLIRDPSATARGAHAWLVARGYSVGKGAVHRHLDRFQRSILEARSSAELALSFARAVRQEGAGVLTDATLSRFEQLMMEQLFRMQLDQDRSPKEFTELSRSLSNMVRNREGMERLRRDFEKEKRQLARIADRAAKKKGATPKDVAERIREFLGA